MAAASMAARVAYPITHLISMKVIEGPISTLRKWTVVAMVRIEAIVHVTVEAMWAMKPGTRSDKDAAAEPFRPVVSVRSAVVWGIVEVTVWASRGHSDIDSDASRCWARHTQQGSRQDG